MTFDNLPLVTEIPRPDGGAVGIQLNPLYLSNLDLVYDIVFDILTMSCAELRIDYDVWVKEFNEGREDPLIRLIWDRTLVVILGAVKEAANTGKDPFIESILAVFNDLYPESQARIANTETFISFIGNPPG